MCTLAHTLDSRNIDETIAHYTASVASLSARASQVSGLALLASLKHEPAGAGPYPALTLLEAAERIMSDLVILHGVRWLLGQSSFPFDAYTVGLGEEDESGFDIVASNPSGTRLIGEALDTSPGSFRSHQRTLLRKLWHEDGADFRILIVNYAAVAEMPPRALPARQWLIAVDVHDGTATAMRG